MSEKVDVDSLLQRDVVYDGEGYSREGLQTMLTDYQAKHKTDLTSLAELSDVHEALAAEMTRDLVEQKSAWEHLKNIATFHKIGTNFRGLLEKIPLIRDTIPDRAIGELLEEKIEVS